MIGARWVFPDCATLFNLHRLVLWWLVLLLAVIGSWRFQFPKGMILPGRIYCSRTACRLHGNATLLREFTTGGIKLALDALGCVAVTKLL